MEIMIFFSFFAQNRECGYTLEPPQWGGLNEYPQSMFQSKNKKIMYIPVNPSFTISRYIDVKDPIGSKLLFLSPIRSRKGAYPLKTIILRDSDIKR